MKKILLILFSVCALGSCDFLDEESKTQIPLDNYFNDEEEAMLFLYGAYYQVRNTLFGTDFMYLTDTMTDNIDYSSTNVDRKGVAYLTLNVNNSIVKNIWGKLYATIEQCNILIDQLDCEEEKVTMEASITDDLGADSLDIVDLVMSLEEEFDVEIPDDQVENIKTVGDIVKYIEDKVE